MGSKLFWCAGPIVLASFSSFAAEAQKFLQINT